MSEFRDQEVLGRFVEVVIATFPGMSKGAVISQLPDLVRVHSEVMYLDIEMRLCVGYHNLPLPLLILEFDYGSNQTVRQCVAMPGKFSAVKIATELDLALEVVIQDRLMVDRAIEIATGERRADDE